MVKCPDSFRRTIVADLPPVALSGHFVFLPCGGR
jgi:hypothetical protein